MVHLNGNLLCAIDCETTGLQAGYHDIIQVCVLPLGHDLEPNKKVAPFYIDIKPMFPERADWAAMNVTKLEFSKLIIRALDPFRAADLFDTWFQKLGLAFGKKIVPLAHNWPYDRGFITEWLGKESYDQFFHFHHRDLLTACLYINDRSDHIQEPIPFPKLKLSYIAGLLKIPKFGAHDALQDCIATAKAYKHLLRYTDHVRPNDEIGKMLKPHMKWGEDVRDTLKRILKENEVLNARISGQQQIS
jgi:DNA polymerase III epsilon subunit-like protein